MDRQRNSNGSNNFNFVAVHIIRQAPDSIKTKPVSEWRTFEKNLGEGGYLTYFLLEPNFNSLMTQLHGAQSLRNK
jgi:hypothetical protein